MSDARYITCKCPGSSRNSGWSYSTDDLFCPGCGFPVSRLVSVSQFPPDSGKGPLWLYPGGASDRFDLSLRLEFADSERRVRRRRPQINFDNATVTDSRFSLAVGTASEENLDSQYEDSRALTCQLVPSKSQGSSAGLPESGIECRLDGLDGDCRERFLAIRLGNKPAVRIELVGDAIEPHPQGDGFIVAASDNLNVELHVHAIDAPIVVKKRVDRQSVTCRLDDSASEHTQVQFILKTPLEAGEIITPGTPWKGKAEFDTSALIEGQCVKLKVPVETHVARPNRGDWQIKIVRVEKVGLEISPNPLIVPVMYFGEHRSNAIHDRTQNPEGPKATDGPPVVGRVFVKNRGKTPVTLAEITLPPSATWIKAAWSRDVAEGSKRPRTESQLELASQERGEIYISVDLRKITKDQLEDGGSLLATLQFWESENPEPHQTQIVINRVKEREPCPFPLCIDFGNTSSFAAIRNPNNKSDTPWLREDIVAAHDLSKPESFPTALFIHRISMTNVLDSEYEIGSAATAEMEKYSESNNSYGAFVSDLKRWIGDSEHAKPVIDLHGNHRSFDVKSLIIMYLWRIIERAEAILRRYTIQGICVSHPSKYSLKRREAFSMILESLCDEVTRARQIPLSLVRDEKADPARYQDIDEANAVAVGSVFDDETRDTLRKMVSPERSSFTIASFDLGGGSLDTALIQFEVRKGLIAVPRYTTSYLGIGGDDAFGGDHVTFVVFDLLKKRIWHALNTAGLPADSCLSCIPSPLGKDGQDPERRRNYDVLWDVAEHVKIYRCTHPDDDSRVSGGLPRDEDPETPTPSTTTYHDSNFSDGNTNISPPVAEGDQQPIGQRSDDANDSLNALRLFVHTRLVNDLVLDPNPGGGLTSDKKCVDVVKKLVESDGYLIPLNEIYEHEVNDDLSGGQELWTVRSRLEECIQELVDFAESNETVIDLVIRCGSGSQLPLVEEIFRRLRDKDRLPTLQEAKILPEWPSQNSKFRVAHGLVRFLDAAGEALHRFARSSDYTSSAFAIGPALSVASGDIDQIPNCAPVNSPETWYAPRSQATRNNKVQTDLTLADLGLHANDIAMYRIDRGHPPVKHGSFDVTQPPDDPAGGLGEPLNNEIIEQMDPIGAVRLVGSERNIELKIDAETGCLGIWRIILD